MVNKAYLRKLFGILVVCAAALLWLQPGLAVQELAEGPVCECEPIGLFIPRGKGKVK